MARACAPEFCALCASRHDFAALEHVPELHGRGPTSFHGERLKPKKSLLLILGNPVSVNEREGIDLARLIAAEIGCPQRPTRADVGLLTPYINEGAPQSLRTRNIFFLR